MRAAAVGLDPWRVIEHSAHPDELAITEAIVERLEANAVAKVEAQAKEHAFRNVEGFIVALQALGFITRKG